MISKSIREDGRSERLVGSSKDHAPDCMPADNRFFDREDSDLHDPDINMVQAMSVVIAWLGCVLIVVFLFSVAYIALIGWPNEGAVLRSLADSQEVRPVTSEVDVRPIRNESAAHTLKDGDLTPFNKLTVGAVFRDLTTTGEICSLCPELVVVPGGSFVLGAGIGEVWREEWQTISEGPPVQITIGKPFAVGRHAVTFDEWEACAIDGGCASSPNDNGWGRAKRPVINVSWSEATDYVSWLSKKTGKPYRLLSEAEREYVTRAGSTTAFWFGQAPSPKLANYLWNRTMPVDSLTANAWGLFHVHGNVSEWTADCWNSSHQGHSGLAAARQSGNCKRRVVKGGAWFNSPNLLRSAARAGLSAASRYKTVGLRVARIVVDGR